MAKATPTPEKPPPTTITVADVHALADRFERDASTSRQVDWPSLQVDMALGAQFLRWLTKSREPAAVVDMRELATRLERDGTTKARPADWEAVQEDLLSGAKHLRELTEPLDRTDIIKLDD